VPPQRPARVDKTADAIRSALLPEQREKFDADCRHALDQAVAEQSVTPVHAVLEHWHREARSTLRNPDAHRRFLAKVDEFERTGEISGPRTPWKQILSERGLG
jgi:hypothetical protein